MEEVQHIRGDTFTVSGQFHGGNHTDWIGKSQVRQQGELVSELSFTWIDAAEGTFVVQTPTDDWPVGRVLLFDVQISSADGSLVKSTATVRVRVIADVTRD